MEQKRNKFWRKQQQNRVFKNRMVLFASYGSVIIRDNGTVMHDVHWFDLAKDLFYKVYKSTVTPCSCIYCKGECYKSVPLCFGTFFFMDYCNRLISFD